MVKVESIGDYEPGKFLGRGHFAKVFLARNIKTGQTVAVKAIDLEITNGHGVVEREIKAMQRLQHTNIVQLYEVIRAGQKIYLIMEYVSGGSLSDLLQKKRPVEYEARFFFIQLIEALQYCHEMGVVHRDLKPENLLLDAQGNLKISDFGLCALLAIDGSNRDVLLKTRCGTRAYIAPELLTTKESYVGAKVDMWACGVILYILLTSRFPFEEENLAEYLRQISIKPFGCPDWFTDDLKVLVRGLLDPDPETRYCIGDVLENGWFRHGLLKDEAPKDIASATSSEKAHKRSAFFSRSNTIEFWFESNLPISKVLKALENIAKDGKFAISKPSVWTLKMTRPEVVGKRERLEVIGRVFYDEAPLVRGQVRFRNGDKFAFQTFVEKELKPGLRHIMVGTENGPCKKSVCCRVR